MVPLPCLISFLRLYIRNKCIPDVCILMGYVASLVRQGFYVLLVLISVSILAGEVAFAQALFLEVRVSPSRIFSQAHTQSHSNSHANSPSQRLWNPASDIPIESKPTQGSTQGSGSSNAPSTLPTLRVELDPNEIDTLVLNHLFRYKKMHGTNTDRVTLDFTAVDTVALDTITVDTVAVKTKIVDTRASDVIIDIIETDASKVPKIAAAQAYINEYIQQKLWDLGFLEARPDSLEIQTHQLTVWIPHDKRYKWSSKPLRYTLPAGDLGNIRDCSQPHSGSYFSILEVSRCRDHLLEQIYDQAYLEASVELDSLILEESRTEVSVVLRISENAPVTMDRFYVKGNRSSDTWLARISGLRTGIRLTASHLEESRQRLLQTQRFISVSEPLILKTDSLWSVAYELREKPLSQFDLVLGYTPSTTGRAQLVGTGSLWLHHVFTEGNHWKLDYQRLKPSAGKLELEIEQVGIHAWPVGVSVKTALTQQDSLWNARVFFLKTWWNYKPELRILSNVFHESIRYPARSSLYDQHGGWYVSLGMSLQTLDNGLNPRRGLDLALMADRGYQRLNSATLGRQRQSRQRVTLNSAWYQPLYKRGVIKGSLMGAWLSTERMQTSDLWRVGGVNSIRGYQEEQFSATRFIIVDLEARYLLDASSNLFVFYSQGLIESPTQQQDPSVSLEVKRLRSFGLGMSYATNLGIMKLSVAKSPEITWTNAMIHIGFSALF